MNNQLTAVAEKPALVINRNLPAPEGDPVKVLEFAHRAAKALTEVVNSKAKKIIINGEQFLTFEDWQTIARFYNTSVGVEWVKPITKKDNVFGFESRAVAYKDGKIVSSAEASCTREEKSWTDKPAFQIKSMSQTRAMAKCLRNIFAFVAVLSNYQPTPAEEVMFDNPAPITKAPAVDMVEDESEYNASKNYRAFEESSITEKQIILLTQLLTEKVLDEEERQERINSITELSKSEASAEISRLINNCDF
ncbi:MAG: hypothetical protein WC526_02300 [Patescibacteria group bacterium]